MLRPVWVWKRKAGTQAKRGKEAKEEGQEEEGTGLRTFKEGDEIEGVWTKSRGCDAHPHCVLPTAYCLLPTTYCLLPTAHCLLPTAYCPLPTAHCPLPTAYFLLPTAYCLLPTSYCLPLPILPTAYCLPLPILPTAYCLLPTSALYCLLPTAYRAVAALEDQGRGQRAGTHADQA